MRKLAAKKRILDGAQGLNQCRCRQCIRRLRSHGTGAQHPWNAQFEAPDGARG